MFKNTLTSWREKIQSLKQQTFAVYLACKDPRTSWYAKVLGLLVVGYAFSPIDLIPDFIPILGYLDDLILIPLGVALVIRMIPEEVMAEYQKKADAVMGLGKPKNWVAAMIIIGIWVLVLLWVISMIFDFMK